MRLVRLQFKKFSQLSDIKADIQQGWCAGVTALVSHHAGAYSPEDGVGDRQWALNAFTTISTVLDNINNKSVTVTTENLQQYLGTVDMRTVENVCGSIHSAEYNGRGCKVLLSVSAWVPLLGHAYCLWDNKWPVNHVGYLARVGNYMLLFDPNYGLGLFQITDTQPLTLSELTSAVMDLAWAGSAWNYYMSYTSAIAVIDEDALRLRISNTMLRQVRELSEAASRFEMRS